MKRKKRSVFSRKTGEQAELTVYVFDNTYACIANNKKKAEEKFRFMTEGTKQDNLWQEYAKEKIPVKKLPEPEYMDIAKTAIRDAAKKYNGWFGVDPHGSSIMYADVTFWVYDEMCYDVKDVKVWFDHSYGMYTANVCIYHKSDFYQIPLQFIHNGVYDEDKWFSAIEYAIDNCLRCEYD